MRDTRLPLDDLRKYIEERPLGIEKINVFLMIWKSGKLQRQELIEKNIASVSSSLGNNIEINQIGCDKGDGLYIWQSKLDYLWMK